MSARRVVVHGDVQGVGFRWSCRREADRLGVTGWVRNRPDGTVEAVVDGPDDAVDRMLGWLRTGPPGASVSRTEVAVAEPSGFTRFQIED